MTVSDTEALTGSSHQQSTVSFSDRARLGVSKQHSQNRREDSQGCHQRTRRGLPEMAAQTDNDQKRQTTIWERPKVIRFFIPPFSQKWVHFFSSKIKWYIRLRNLPLLCTISGGHLAVYYEDFYSSFNLPVLYEIVNITDQNYYVTIPVATPSPGLPHQCSRKSPPRNTSSVRCSVSPPNKLHGHRV